MSHEIFDNVVNATVVAGPLGLMSLPPLLLQSEPGAPHPVRELDVLFLSDFFDHAGNFCNGILASQAAIIAASAFSRKGKQQPVVALAALGAVTAGTANYVYESGVSIPPFVHTSETTPDLTDAAYGTASGVLFSLAFCVSALMRRRR